MSCAHCHPGGQPTPVAESTSSHRAATIFLVGNPNVGKSTLFNALTGGKQTVINAPGTTVEVATGYWRRVGARLLDLPGTYSLVAQSPDEQMVVDTLAAAPGSFPHQVEDASAELGMDLVVCVLDATAITRSLYLLAQVARTGHPLVAVLTHQDVAQKDGTEPNPHALEEVLGIPVIALDPRAKESVKDFEKFIAEALPTKPRPRGIYPDPAAPGYNQAAATKAKTRGRANLDKGLPGEAEQAAELFSWVDQVEKQLGRAEKRSNQLSRSDKIDQVLLHPVFGVAVFFALMWLLFKVAGEWIGPIQDFLDALVSSTAPGAVSLANVITAALGAVGLQNTWVEGLLVGGLASGLGVVASFVPLMFTIFLMISVLEDSGYMARAAFLGDRLMRLIGLDGRVILPLIMGFGCNLPALAAVRTLPNARQRLVTILITPYTSCAARLTIYLMIARIFFPNHTGTVVFALYLLSVLMVVLGALLLKPFFTKGEVQAPLMLVLPPYGNPRILGTLRSAWLRSWAFVKGAGKIIVGMTMVVWLMGAVPTSPGYSFADPGLPMQDSLYGRAAQSLEPVFAPTGFGEWHLTGALLTGFVAKETVISSIVVSYNMDESSAGDAEDGGADLGELPDLVRGSFEESAGDLAPLAAFAFLVFVLTYTPCMATVAEQARQVGGKITTIALVSQLVVAWLLATGIYQFGKLLL